MNKNKTICISAFLSLCICSIVWGYGGLGSAYGQNIEPGYTALWFSPERAGEGWVLEVLTEDRALMYWFTFDEDGEQRWLMDDGRIDGNRIVFDELLFTRGGRLGNTDPDTVERVIAGEAVMTFDDCDNGAIEYSAFGQSQRLEFERLTRTSGLNCGDYTGITSDPHAGLTGTWFEPEHAGEGLILQWMSRDEGMLIWFTYDNDGNQQWILGSGQLEGQDILFSDLHTAAGALFGADFDAGDVEREAWGELKLSMDCESGIAHWNSIHPEFGSGELNIRSLSRPEAAKCDFPTNAWSGNGPYGGVISFLEVSPDNPERFYAGGRNGLYRSDDEGISWQDVFADFPYRRLSGLAVDPFDADVVYAVAADHLFKSIDAGVSWQRFQSHPDSDFSAIVTIDINPENSQEITVGSSRHNALFRSVDGGESWVRLETLDDGVYSFSYWPGNRDIVLAVTRRGNSAFFSRSTDGGLPGQCRSMAMVQA